MSRRRKLSDLAQARKNGSARGVPKWLKPPRSPEAELNHQLRRLGSTLGPKPRELQGK
jgi:hypothetical protein